jgi:hypothetical protein
VTQPSLKPLLVSGAPEVRDEANKKEYSRENNNHDVSSQHHLGLQEIEVDVIPGAVLFWHDEVTHSYSRKTKKASQATSARLPRRKASICWIPPTMSMSPSYGSVARR